MLVWIGLVYALPTRFLKWRFAVMVRYEAVVSVVGYELFKRSGFCWALMGRGLGHRHWWFTCDG